MCALYTKMAATTVDDHLRNSLLYIAFGLRCKEASVRPSMGSVGDAYDNAMSESFFASLETELIERKSFRNQAEARMAVFDFIEAWYNPHRRHSALGQMSPLNYEKEHAPAA